MSIAKITLVMERKKTYRNCDENLMTRAWYKSIHSNKVRVWIVIRIILKRYLTLNAYYEYLYQLLLNDLKCLKVLNFYNFYFNFFAGK